MEGHLRINTKKSSLMHYFVPHRLAIAATALCGLLTVWSSLTLPYIMRLVIEDLENETLTPERLWRRIGLFIAVGTVALSFPG